MASPEGSSKESLKLDTIPTELIIKIAENLAHDTYEAYFRQLYHGDVFSWTIENAAAWKDLRNLCLVSRRICSVAQPAL